MDDATQKEYAPQRVEVRAAESWMDRPIKVSLVTDAPRGSNSNTFYLDEPEAHALVAALEAALRPEVREEIARVIDPDAWLSPESFEEEYGGFPEWSWGSQPKRQEQALRKADAILARLSVPTLDVERLTRWLVENRRLVAGSAWEYVDSEGTASALIAALPTLTREETNE